MAAIDFKKLELELDCPFQEIFTHRVNVTELNDEEIEVDHSGNECQSDDEELQYYDKDKKDYVTKPIKKKLKEGTQIEYDKYFESDNETVIDRDEYLEENESIFLDYDSDIDNRFTEDNTAPDTVDSSEDCESDE